MKFVLITVLLVIVVFPGVSVQVIYAQQDDAPPTFERLLQFARFRHLSNKNLYAIGTNQRDHVKKQGYNFKGEHV